MKLQGVPPYYESKLAELIVYIAAKCQLHARFGATKLNKILFYADFLSYQERGKAITGAEYQKLPHGPAPVRLKPVEEALISSMAVVKQETSLFAGSKYIEKRLIALRQPNLSMFDGEEIALVDSVIDQMKDLTGKDVSDISHGFLGWQLARPNERIPYFTVYLPDEVAPLSAKDAEWAESVVKRMAA
jgi:hypothetical protein